MRNKILDSRDRLFQTKNCVRSVFIIIVFLCVSAVSIADEFELSSSIDDQTIHVHDNESKKLEVESSNVKISEIEGDVVPSKVEINSDDTLAINEKPFLYIKSLKAIIYSEPSFESSSITELARGNEVVVIDTQPLWSLIEFDDSKSGWVYSMLLSKQKPLKLTNRLEEASDVPQSQKVRASMYASSAAARGVKDAEDDFNESYPANHDAVRQMEMQQVDQKEALDFIMKDFVD